MKSAYELAMERLAQNDPEASRPLSAEQKDRLAEIDRVYKGKWAEREIFLTQHLNTALAGGKFEEFQQVKRQLVDEKLRLEEDCESEKELVRRASR